MSNLVKISVLDEKIEKYCKENGFMGLLRITVKEKILYQKAVGYADIANREPFTNDTRFSFYSLSKPFCALGLLKLVEKGLVDLDAHPARYLPEAQGFDGKVTVRHLLLHESGLPDFLRTEGFAGQYAHGYAKEIRAQLPALAKYPSFFEAGTRGIYENINFTLCALIIESVTGVSYAEYMQKEVFLPLGAKTAVIDNENKVIPCRAKGYGLVDDKLAEVDRSINWMFGAGDMVGALDDAYRLNIAVKNKLLLTEETWALALTPSAVSGFAMGCRVIAWRGKKRIVHNGGHTGFRTLHAHIVEDDFDIIILSNTGFGSARDDLTEIIHNFFYGEDETLNQKIEMDAGYI